MNSLLQETKTNWSSVSAPWWPEVWIVGGGPSALKSGWPPGLGSQILAINSAAYYTYPECVPLAVFTADPDWHNRHFAWAMRRNDIREAYACVPEYEGTPGVQYLQRDYHNALSEDPAKLSVIGGNSGYAAINLAVLKRARLIHLVGFDMVATNGEEEFKFGQWIPHFRAMRKELDRLGVKVLNHNPASHVDAFEKV